MTDSSRRYSLGKEVDTWDPYDRQGRPPESQSPQATSTPPHIRDNPTHTKTTTRPHRHHHPPRPTRKNSRWIALITAKPFTTITNNH
jgi:hypothetical protein